MKTIHTPYLLFLLALALVYSCKKQPQDPSPAAGTGPIGTITVTITSPVVGSTSVVNDPTDTTSSVSGRINGTGGAAVTQHGHVYSPNSTTPTVADSKTELGALSGTAPVSFTSHLVLLQPATTYLVRAYATNSAGTSYGSLLTVVTADKKVLVKVPSWDGVTGMDSIAPHSFRIRNTLASNGGGPILQHGHVYSSTSQTPTIADSKTELGPATGTFPYTFISRPSGLNENTAYYVRAYASNSAGVSYETVSKLTTLAITPPVVANLKSNLQTTETTLIVSAQITDSGNELPSKLGFVYTDKGSLPTTADPQLQRGISSLSPSLYFDGLLKDLRPNTPYNIRAYATNSRGTAYSNMITLKTDNFFWRSSDISPKLTGTDIGVSANDHVWVIASSGAYGNVYEYQSTTNTWVLRGVNLVNNGESIAVMPDGTPWIINKASKLSYYKNNKWEVSSPADALGISPLLGDIGIGANGAMWVIGMDFNVNGILERYVYKVTHFSGGQVSFERFPTIPTPQAIAVDPDGHPWVISDNGTAFYHNGSSWNSGRARGISVEDVAVEKDGTVWLTGKITQSTDLNKPVVYRLTKGVWERYESGLSRVAYNLAAGDKNVFMIIFSGGPNIFKLNKK